VANQSYATLAQLKARIGIDAGTTDYDAELQDALDAAHESVNDDTGRVFTLAGSATARIFNPDGRVSCRRTGYVLLVDDIGDTAGLIVEIGSGTSWAPVVDFETKPDNGIAKGDAIYGLLSPYLYWGYSPAGRVRVTAKWGWPTVPAKIKQATLLKAQRLYSRKESPTGVAAFGDFGPIRVAKLDSDYQDAISRYVLDGFGGPV